MNNKERRSSAPRSFGFETYLSPFTYKYGSSEMRENWSQERFWTNVRDVWIAKATVENEIGMVTDEQLRDLRKNKDRLSVGRILELERETGHDVAGAIAEYSEVAPEGGKILHNAMTSEDALSNAEIAQIQEAFGIVRPKVIGVLDAFAEKIDKTKNLVCMGYTHLQAAEPTTMGYRFAKYAQDLLTDLRFLDFVNSEVKGKGLKGAVGTAASFSEILKDTRVSPDEYEQRVMDEFGLDYVTISDQTYPRKMLFLTGSSMASIGQSLHRFALDVQILQSSFVDEISEPRKKGQVGSAAMPHKANPVNSENIDALTEELPGETFSAWMAGAFVTLERTLRDSAGKRSWLPESFLIVDESLMRAERIIRGMSIHENSIRANLNKFAPYMATEVLMAKLVKTGMDRKEAHEVLVGHAEIARDSVREGKANPMRELVEGDERIVSLLGELEIDEAFEGVFSHVGTAPARCEVFLEAELYPAINS
jgi:adenylosuccinate lyase